ncbi:hypothetical protein SK128_006042 [Halocaridina rubra]|uniref:Uncharacterized protein n=1 Tax=Halocaridina rubra TaxID=373956 RepID=A0AAN8WKZ0_HALRR
MCLPLLPQLNKLPTSIEVLGSGAAAVATAVLINVGVSLFSSKTGISLRRRRQLENSLEENEIMVEELVKLWAALEDLDECRVRAWCRLGGWLGSYRGGSLLAILARYLFSPHFEPEMNHVVKGALYNSDCKQWMCGRNLSDAK